MGKFEKFVYLGSPWLFGVVLTISGIFAAKETANKLPGVIMICSGLLCISFYCVCALLAKIAEKDK